MFFFHSFWLYEQVLKITKSLQTSAVWEHVCLYTDATVHARLLQMRTFFFGLMRWLRNFGEMNKTLPPIEGMKNTWSDSINRCLHRWS